MEPPKEWHDIADLARRWKWSQKDVEHLFESRQLYARYRFKTNFKAVLLKPTSKNGRLEPTNHTGWKSGLFVLVDYGSIVWKWNCGDIGRSALLDLENDQYFLTVDDCSINKDEIIVLERDVLRFEVEKRIKIVNGVRVDDPDIIPQKAQAPPKQGIQSQHPQSASPEVSIKRSSTRARKMTRQHDIIAIVANHYTEKNNGKWPTAVAAMSLFVKLADARKSTLEEVVDAVADISFDENNKVAKIRWEGDDSDKENDFEWFSKRLSEVKGHLRTK